MPHITKQKELMSKPQNLAIASAKTTNFEKRDPRNSESTFWTLTNLSGYKGNIYIRSRWRSLSEYRTLLSKRDYSRCGMFYCRAETNDLGPYIRRARTFDLIKKAEFAKNEIQENRLVLNKVVPKKNKPSKQH